MDNLSNAEDWQVKCDTVHARLQHLLSTKRYADCRFLVGDEEKEEVSAHKFVLSMASPVFDTMFHGVMAEKENTPITVIDIQPQIFKLLLRFIYTDTAVVPTLTAASELYYAAKKYMIPSIQKHCIKLMSTQVAPHTACFIHEFACMFEENELLIAAFKVIRSNTKSVVRDVSFEDVALSTVELIFTLPWLAIDSELDLFEAAERYAEAHGLKRIGEDCDTAIEGAKKPRLDEDLSTSEENKETNIEQIKDVSDDQDQKEKIRAGLRKSILHVRFLTLTPRLFARGVAKSVLLTDEEAHAIMLNLVNVSVPMPAGFSRSKEMRNVSNEARVRVTPTCPALEAICVFSVCNFKTRKRPVRSDPFWTGDVEWCVNVVPGTEIRDGQDVKTLGIYVEAATKSPWQATVTVELVSDYSWQTAKHSFHHTYSSTEKSKGYRNFMSWSSVCDARAGLLRGNTLRVRVRVAAAPAPPAPAPRAAATADSNR